MSNALLDRPVGAGEHGRSELEQRHALARHVLAALEQQLGRLRGDPHLHAGAVRRLDDLEHRASSKSPSLQDHLVGRHARDPASARLSPDCGAQRADELVREPAAGSSAAACSEARLAPSPRAGRADGRAACAAARCERVVGGPQEADHDRAGDERGRDQAGRREVVVRAEPEGERDGGDEDERRGDPAEAARAARAARTARPARRRAR